MAKTHPTAISSLMINLNLIAHHNNMKKPEEFLSQSKYAEHRNVTKGYIGRLIKEGQ